MIKGCQTTDMNHKIPIGCRRYVWNKKKECLEEVFEGLRFVPLPTFDSDHEFLNYIKTLKERISGRKESVYV